MFGRFRDEVGVILAAVDRLTPTYELWTIRHEVWLPEFAGVKLNERNRLGEGGVGGGAKSRFSLLCLNAVLVLIKVVIQMLDNLARRKGIIAIPFFYLVSAPLSLFPCKIVDVKILSMEE